MGVGDLTVPKRMQKYAEAFYGRSAAYEKALAAGASEAAVLAVARNVFGREEPLPGARRLADYMFETAAALVRIDDAMLERGQFTFPAPTYMANAGAADDR